MKNIDALSRHRDDEIMKLSPAVIDEGPISFVDDEDEIDGQRFFVKQYWQSVKKYLWLIISFTVVVTFLTLVYVAQKPDYFLAIARVQVNAETNPALGASKNSSVFLSSSYDPTYFSSQLQIIEGSGLLRRVVKTIDLEHNQAFLNPNTGERRSVWQNVWKMVGFGGKGKAKPSPGEAANQQFITTLKPNPVGMTEDEEIERLAPYVGKIKSGLYVSPVKESRVTNKETRLIDIIFNHYDPVVAAKVVNTIADTYVAMNFEKKTTSNEAAGDFLQKRIAELQTQIRTREEQLINYSKSNQIISLDPNQNTVVQRLSDLNTRLSQAEGERIMSEAAYRASLEPGAAAAQVESADALSTQLTSRLNELRHRREQLLVEMTEAAPEVVEIDKQITLIEKDVQDTRRRATTVLTTNLETKFRETLAREQDLKKAFDQQRSEVLSQNEAAINYRIIQQEIETYKSLLDGLLQRSKENDMILNGTPNNILVLDRALIPRSPVGPERFQYVILAFLASLGLGVGCALAVNFLDRSVRTIEDIEYSLHLPVLSEIPSVIDSGQKRLNFLTGRRQAPNTNAANKALLSPQTPPAAMEAYLQLRTCILLSTAGGPPEILLVTSSQQAEGKTTTAVNLSIVLAQTGAKVLIIDADLRRPNVHMQFEMDNEHGLSDLLAGKSADEQQIRSTIKLHEATGVNILQAGRVPPNAANLITSPQMRRLIANLRTKFDHIIIDSSPAFYFTDSVLLSTMADGVLLVVRCGRSTQDVVHRTRKMLRDVGAKILGVVLNDVQKSEAEYYAYGYGSAEHIKEGNNQYLPVNSN